MVGIAWKNVNDVGGHGIVGGQIPLGASEETIASITPLLAQ